MSPLVAPDTPLSLNPGISAEAEALEREVTEGSRDSVSLTVGEPRREALLALLQAYERARINGWDGEGAAAMSPGTVRYAAAFLAALPTQVPVPDIMTDRDGEAYLEWDRGPRAVMTVTIGPDGSLSYACLVGHTGFHGREMFKDRVPARILDGIAGALGVRRDS